MNAPIYSLRQSGFIKILFLLVICSTSCKNQSHVSTSHPHTNALIHESSPYLLQHAHNPVDWQPWSEEALQQAKEENKLLIISIGYAACHWCHVMEYESFEDSLVASIMNEHFIPIKVDREERPDVDDIYMSAAQLITGNGGWPLNAFALPDGRPIWAGTYFPKEQWLDILKRFKDLKENDYAKLESSATQLTSGIGSLDAVQLVQSDQEYTPQLLAKISEQFKSQIDMKRGGRKGAPKFPMPNNWEYLLKYADKSGDTEALQGVLTTLNEMANGGIYDQIGGGFARYSVDAQWKAPHFEKMLYDNGQLVSLYAQAYQKTKDDLYKQVIKESLEFINRELMSSDGGFYSSLDADSEGEEGKFYVWTDAEIDAAISDEQQRTIIKDLYTVSSKGNWEHGNNILHITQSIDKILKRYDISATELSEIITTAKKILLNKRAERVRPGLDDKILTSWNALMIKGYVDAYRALQDVDYLDQAIISAHHILKHQLQVDGRLNRNLKDGKSSINAFLDDYANLIQALISLYEVTFDESWLTLSKELADYTIAHFYNKENGMFNYTSDIDPPLVARKMELADKVIPGSNSMMARNLLTLGEILYTKDYTEKAQQMMKNMMPTLVASGQPSFYSNWLQVMFDLTYPPYEIVTMGVDAIDKTHEMMTSYTGNAIFLGDTKESALPLLLNKYMDGETMIYVCQNKVCKLPVSEVDQALSQIK